MGIFLSVLGLVLVFGVLSLVFHPNRKKYVMKPVREYETICKGCGASWLSETKDETEMKKCPRCPSKMCMDTAMKVIQLGSINELVVHQPDNLKAVEKKKELETWLEEHVKTCSACKEELGC